MACSSLTPEVLPPLPACALQVVQAWAPRPGTLPSRMQGVLQVAGGPQPRTALLALKDRLAQLDLRCGGGGSLQQLWQCPQGQHLTAMCAPLPALAATSVAAAAAGLGSGTAEHLLAAACSRGGRGSGAHIMLFDLRRPAQPVATWEQPPLSEEQEGAATLLRWLPLAATGAAGGGGGPSAAGGRGSAEPQQPWGGLLLAGCGGSGRVVGCEYTAQAAGPALQARGGRIQEKPAGAGTLLMERLQAALEQQLDEAAAAEEEEEEERSVSDEERQKQQQQEQQLAGAALVPPALRPPPALPLPLQLLWQPAHATAVAAVPGPPLQLLAPPDKQSALEGRLAAGRLLLQKQQAAAGGGIEVRLK